MARLVYSAIASLDGYVADQNGDFHWAAPDEEVHAFVNSLERSVGTYLYGRRMYQTMVYWETEPADAGRSPAALDYGKIWRAADKVVYSRTLTSAGSARTRIEPRFDPAAVRQMKASLQRDISVGGPELAAQALKAGLVDECHLLLVPFVVGGGTPALPSGVFLQLDLLDESRFRSGVVHLHYRVGSPEGSNQRGRREAS
jgi:dihydrofolate reductase